MPARSTLSFAPSMTMRTGTRWVIFTQLPLAFCAGISAN